MSETSKPDDLSSLLSQEAGTGGTEFNATESDGTGQSPVAQASETAFDLDDWGMRRGAECNADWQEQGLEPIEDTTVPADCHEALFNPSPVLSDNCADKRRSQWFQQLIETPDFKALHNQTMLDSDLSSIAARQLCDNYVEYAATEPEQEQPGGEESIDETVNRLRSTGKAIAQAKDDTQAAKDTSIGLGAGTGSQIDKLSLAKAFKAVRNSAFLKRVMALAGRFRNRCASLQKQKMDSKSGEVVGIELSGDVSRLIPSERLALVSDDPIIRERAEFRLLRRRSLSYKHKLSKPVSQGPIVIDIDESGSMSGKRIETAKAICLTMAWLASQQNRWCALVAFCGSAEGRVLALPPRHKKQAELIEWIEQFMNGGTTLDVSCETVPNVYWPEFIRQGMPRGKTDHIIITDGCLDCSDELQASYREFCKRETVKTYGIVIGCNDAGELAKVCDKVFCVDDLSLDSEAVESILSI